MNNYGIVKHINGDLNRNNFENNIINKIQEFKFTSDISNIQLFNDTIFNLDSSEREEVLDGTKIKRDLFK